MTARAQPWWRTAALCAAVIAVCYGFARYAYGLFVPRFGTVFGLSGTGLGLLGGASTLGYTAGLVLAPAATRRSARGTTVAAGALAAAGLATMAAPGPVALFAIGLAVAGSGAGLVSPGVAQLINQTVRARVRVQAQTWANTGTSLGLVASAATPTLATGWRPIWTAFALSAAAVALLAFLSLPRGPRTLPSEGLSSGPVRREGLAALLANSALLGLVSAPYWNFSRDLALRDGLTVQMSAWFWGAIGAAGLLGGVAGRFVHRYGLSRTNIGTWTVWSAGIAILALPGLGPIATLLSAAAFGAGYMALSGMCILWAERLYPNTPALGVTLSFCALGAGQTIGAPAAGALADFAGLPAVFAASGALGLLSWFTGRTASDTQPTAPEREPADRE
ncbi:MFS transporter [Amycolatopsis nivea]